MDIPVFTLREKQGIHYVLLSGIEQIINLTKERRDILSFFPISCQKYYILSEVNI